MKIYFMLLQQCFTVFSLIINNTYVTPISAYSYIVVCYKPFITCLYADNKC